MHPTVPSLHMQRLIPAAAAAAVSLLLAACGGNPGSAPVITAQPANVNAAEGSQASISVSATSDAGELTYQWLDVDNAVDITGATGATLSLAPVSLAAQGARYQVRLNNAQGSTLSDVSTLSVVERTWSAAAPAVSSAARQTATVVDSNGHTHLLAITGDGLSAGVTARLKPAGTDSSVALPFAAVTGGALQADEALSVTTTSIASAANRTGHVMAVWHRNGIIGAALYTPGPDAQTPGAWTLAPTRINSMTSASALDPAVAAAGDDAFEIVWRERMSGWPQHDMMARRYTISSNTLATPVIIEAQAGEAEAPRIVSDPSGNVLAAWRQDGVGVVINRRLAADAWGTSTTLIDGTVPYVEALRGNALGRAVLLMSDRVGYAYVARLDLAATDPVAESSRYVANAYGSAPDAMVAADGSIHVVGVSVNVSGGNVSRLFHWSCTPNGNWNAPESVSDMNSADFIATGLGVYNPRISEPAVGGSFIVVWQDRVATGSSPLSQVSAKRYHGALGWRATAAVVDSNNQPVSLTQGPSGAGTVVFGSPAAAAVDAAHFR
jgi:hypothetical protein